MDISFGGSKPANQNQANHSGKGAAFPNQKVPSPQDTTKRFDEEISTITRRLKLIENSLSNVRSATESLEKTTVDQNKENRRDIKLLEDENTELKEQVRTLRTTLKKIISDMSNVAMANDVKVIQKYLDLWNPVKFATPEMVKRIAREEIDNSHKRQFDSRMESISRDVYQKQDLKDHINEVQTANKEVPDKKQTL